MSITPELPPPPNAIIWNNGETYKFTYYTIMPALEHAKANYTEGEHSGRSFPMDWLVTNPNNPSEQFSLHVYSQFAYPQCENEVRDLDFVHSIKNGDDAETILEEIHIRVVPRSLYDAYTVEGSYKDNAGKTQPLLTKTEVTLTSLDMLAQIMAF